ncbi:enkurin-like [Scleropages formosus]|uniref:Enkurin, TRPC channel interacting protein n=1 Tax=Scleropages formosus TaxID=113540 RepID=A0A0N8JYV0_SCLFO|nr:enkurin [Scleropages formosus]KPP67553.1 enkurin-like [Scleropages formosus]
MNKSYPAASIYNLIPQEELKTEKPPRYISKFKDQVKQEAQLNKGINKTMGPAKVEVPTPKRFLLKHCNEPKLPENVAEKPISYMACGKQRKPPVPLKDENPLKSVQRSSKDFVKSNAIENIMAMPKKPQPIYADTRNGDKHRLESSGLVPKYIKKKDYGQTPEYLQQRKEEARRAQEEYDSYVKEHLQQRAMKQLSEEERQTILQGLKENWGELHHQFQGLSVITDTLPKRMRKERLEMEMKQLERDIELIERHKTIYVANN